MLTFDDVTVRYAPGAYAALTGLDLAIGAGEVVALVGPSGAGKSTVLRLAAGLVLPSAGTVEVLGVDSRRLGDRTGRPTRARIGSIHQDFALVGPLRVAHNVAAGRLGTWSTGRALRSLFRPVDPDGVTTALDRVGIADKVSERADRLSGGQQQRTAIARVLYQQPDLFLADEPCSALDPARAGDVLGELTGEVRRREGRALVMSLHDADLAVAYADRVVGLRDGVVTFDLAPAEVTAERLTELYALPAAVGAAAEAVRE